MEAPPRPYSYKESGSVASICGALTTSLQHAPPSASARSLHPPGRGILRSMSRPFGVDRNSCHFLWYGVVAGEGLRSVGAASPSKSVCSILPLARHLRAGEVISGSTPARGSLLKPAEINGRILQFLGKA